MPGGAGAAGTSGGFVVDPLHIQPLHIQRFGDDLTDLRRVDRAMLAYVQLCDGPLTVPRGMTVPRQMPRGQPVSGSATQLESRAARLLPGEGEIPVVDFVAALPRTCRSV